MSERPPWPDDGLTMPSVPQSVARIRRYVVDTCTERGFRGNCDTLALLVSEVATNALIHGAGEVHVRVLDVGHRVRIEVADDSETMPVHRTVGADAEGGRGLALVDALSTAWGADVHPGGKTVWFELAA